MFHQHIETDCVATTIVSDAAWHGKFMGTASQAW